jgi:DNA end-binding protein Ku
MEMLKVSIDPSTLQPTKSTAEKKTSSLKKKA